MKIVSVIKIFNLIILLIFLTTSKLYCKDNKYFLSGILNSQKGIRQIKTIAILIAPNRIGGIDALIPSFAVG